VGTIPRIIFVFTAVEWRIYMRRPMVYALAEAAREHGSTVVAVNRPICLQTTAIRRPKQIPDMLAPPRLERLSENLFLYRPKYYVHDQIANLVPMFEKANLKALRHSFSHLQKKLRISEPAPMIWFHYPHQGYVTQIFDGSFNVFEIYDNLTDIEGNEQDYVNRLEVKRRGRIDLLLTTSRKIHEKYAAHYRHTYRFGNGLARDAFEKLSDPDVDPHPDILRIPSPRLGYAGMISERLDWKLIQEVASREPQWQFVLAGRVTDDKLRKRVAHLPNIHFPGEFPQKDVPSILKSFDLGIMPYRDTPFFDFLNPLKFYEMAAAGLPMVSSPVEELKSFPESLVSVVTDNRADPWRKAIRHMLDADPAVPREVGPTTAAGHIWEDMTATLLGKIAADRS
jgi:glycosyltransferase involved in cell wall biosynthesis